MKMLGSEAAGWFGKLAMLGDFASRRLDAPWVRNCDQWLSAGLHASRDEWGAQWLPRYLSAPVWRFACAPGVLDQQDERWWFGVLMPSCDNVGRYYPLVLVQGRLQPPSDRVALDHLELWWSCLAACGLATLADGATLQDFENALAECPPWPNGSGLLRARPQQTPGRTRYLLRPGMTPFDLSLQLAVGAALGGLGGCSLWWRAPHEGSEGHCTVCQGLPPAHAFTALFSGQW
jgi:type VI secretion system protein ImpM